MPKRKPFRQPINTAPDKISFGSVSAAAAATLATIAQTPMVDPKWQAGAGILSALFAALAAKLP